MTCDCMWIQVRRRRLDVARRKGQSWGEPDSHEQIRLLIMILAIEYGRDTGFVTANLSEGYTRTIVAG